MEIRRDVYFNFILKTWKDYRLMRKEWNAVWGSSLRRTLGNGITSQDWIEIDDIVRVLSGIGKETHSNATYFPSGGCSTLLDACAAKEPGCIELKFTCGAPHLVRLRKMSFTHFDGDLQASFFRIFIDPMTPCLLTEDPIGCEPLLEYNSQYFDGALWDRGYLGIDSKGNAIQIPPSARLIHRWFRKGSFVVFSKGSKYNFCGLSGLGRQDKMSEMGFRDFVGRGFRSPGLPKF